MTGKLIVNPCLQLDIHTPEHYFLLAPKPGESLQSLQINKSERPALHELFLELAQTQFDFLDVEQDISAGEREFLVNHGVLVEAEQAPRRPLFACPLDQVEAAPFDGNLAGLIVNPTFRFEPFSFANLTSWIRERNMSPHQASVWIKAPLTGIETGYWLTPKQAETVAGFTAGEKPPTAIEEEFRSRLTAAGVLVTPESLRQNEQNTADILEQTKERFERDKYTVLEKILPPAQMTAMRSFYRQYVSEGFMPFGDSQVELRFRQHNEPLARFYHRNFTRLMSLLVGEEVIPSYVYAASYKPGATLEPHTDRAQCEYSISFQVDYQPEPEDQVSPWALHVTRPDGPIDDNRMYGWEDFPETLAGGEKRRGIHLASGDGLIYRGRELIHYRYALPAGHKSTSLFFHYVPQGFDGELN